MVQTENTIGTNLLQAPTQCARQLDAIESALQRITHRLHRGEAANDVNHDSLQTPFLIQRDTDAIQLLTATRDQRTESSSLQVAALFPGSHSQTDVVVSIKQQDNHPGVRLKKLLLPTEITHSGHTAVHLLDPKCHYLQFSAHTDKTYACFDREGINLVVILPENEPSVHPPQMNNQSSHSIFCLAKLITFVTLDKPANNPAPRAHTLQNRLLAELCRSVDTETRTVQLSEDDSVGLLHLLSQHDIAILPGSGLAMDALNVGCVSAIRNASGHYSLCADEQLDLPGNVNGNSNVVQVRNSLRKIAARQREVLLNKQLESSHGMVVTTRIQQLAYVVESFAIDIFRESVDQQGKSWVPATNDWTSDQSIVPQATQQRADMSLTWSGSYDRACRKLRKLHHSPSQFLSDSQFPILRSLSARYRNNGK